MLRKPRIEFEGAFYHVITRGNQKQKIFRDTTDYQKFIQFLTIYKNRSQTSSPRSISPGTYENAS